MKGWIMWGVKAVAMVAIGAFILSRTPLAGMFGLNQKAPTDLGL